MAKEKRNYRKAPKKRKNGYCASYPSCKNKTVGRSVFCDKCKYTRKLAKTRQSKKFAHQDGRRDTSTYHDAETIALMQVIREYMNPQECQILVEKRKGDLKYLSRAKREAKAKKDWDTVEEINKQITSKRVQIMMLSRKFNREMKKAIDAWLLLYD